MLYITKVHLSGGIHHEHIAEVRWYDPVSRESGRRSRSEVIDWINKGGDARVQDGRGGVQVKVVRGNPPYLRTHVENRPTDKLLELPRY
jgi:hypothetical protein